ncbi:B3 domain-containing protein Os07g0563300-like isoform X2 [Impatiens glandulifera]|uniref:B3 domain-containing protein Os07g0563300-like isoform X2 n=1 Tax=Impatiens glandulifera TaxID=253017 RepID=UPI001FB05038|nr:B3 domain-containing protein Os07g0563300-like isoform X2 [Impatiens glandulifera]
MMTTTSTPPNKKICFNSNCQEVLSRSRKGWRRRTGDFAELCDRCASSYEEGKFCDTFHLNSLGWRCCEFCGKKVHCGCIVSFHLFVLLDDGGIECMLCARKSFILTPNPALPPPSSLMLPVQSERIKDLSVMNQSAGSGTLPWRQSPSSFIYTTQSGSHQPVTSEVDAHSSSSHITSELFTADRILNGSPKFVAGDMVGTSNGDYSNINIFQKLSLTKTEKKDFQFASSASQNAANGQTMVSQNHLLQPNTLVNKEYGGHCGVDLSGETQVWDGRSRADALSKIQLLSRYSPRIIDQDLKQISVDPNYVVTPLFEKMLSASDAGRIGRLVLPKRCAEAYFPTIYRSEGLPIKIQDLKGNEWVFQFRYWLNNCSRMYVLEGVTPCIQSMQLKAGDIVTFGRIEPEGKLVMGFRKAPTSPLFDHGNENQDSEKMAPSALPDMPSSKQAKTKYQASSGGSKKKRSRIETENLVELKLTLEEVQVLLRPPPNLAPVVVAIEGFGFEEYKNAPIIGRPTIFATDKTGEKVQWVQCEECLKWRKISAGAFIPSEWTCSKNSCDPRRSSCSASQELTTAELEELLKRENGGGCKKMKEVTKGDDDVMRCSFKRQIDLNMQPERDEEEEEEEEEEGSSSIFFTQLR